MKNKIKENIIYKPFKTLEEQENHEKMLMESIESNDLKKEIEDIEFIRKQTEEEIITKLTNN